MVHRFVRQKMLFVRCNIGRQKAYDGTGREASFVAVSMNTSLYLKSLNDCTHGGLKD